MLDFFKKRWFLISLLILISSGLTIGRFGNAVSVEGFKDRIPTQTITAFVLLLMAFSLDSRQLKASLKAPAPTLWATVCNYGLIPLLGMALVNVQLTNDFRIGLMIAVSTPCTLAAASVWTRKACGNDAVSLLTTLVTNGLCFVLTPLLLGFITDEQVRLNTVDLGQKLVVVVLVPTIAGQMLRQPAALSAFATRHKTPLGVVAQSSILFLVFLSALGGGVQLQRASITEQLAAVCVVWLSCIAIHSIALAAAWYGGGLLGFSRPDRIGCTFAGSQKTLPVGVYLATVTFGGPSVVDGLPVPFAVFPMLMFHASQLFIDTIVADRMASAGQGDQPTATT